MKTIFSNDVFWAPRLGAADVSSLPPDARRDQLDEAYTTVMEAWFKTMDTVNGLGGIGDSRLKALLGPDYDAFVNGFNVETQFFKQVEPVIAKTSFEDPTVWQTITQSDFDTVNQWKYITDPLNEMVKKHITGSPAAAAPGAAGTPAAASIFPTTTVLAGVGIAGIGALLYATLVR